MRRGTVEREGRAASVQWLVSAVLLIALRAHSVNAQDAAAVRLHELVNRLTVTPRILIIGAHPDDDDPLLIEERHRTARALLECEVVGLLHRRHRDVGMSGELVVQRRRTAARRPDDDKGRQRHVLAPEGVRSRRGCADRISQPAARCVRIGDADAAGR